MAKKKTHKVAPSSYKNEFTYLSWGQHFEESLHSILTQINSFEKNLTSEQVTFLSKFSFDFLEQAHLAPREYLTQYLPFQKPTVTDVKISTPKHSSQKNILFVTGVFPGTSHAGGLRVFDLIEELSLKGYNVYVYASFAHAQMDKGTQKILKKIAKKIHIASAPELNAAALTQWLKDLDVQMDIVYHVWPDTSKMLGLTSRDGQKAFFEFIEVTTRRVWIDLVSYIENKKFEQVAAKIGELWYSYHHEKIAFENFDGLICLTEKDAQFLQNLFGRKKIAIVRTGISRHAVLNDLQKYAKIKPQANSVGFLGNYDHYPNLDGVEWYLENVHERVLKKVPNYTFHVMGKGDLKPLKKKFSRFKGNVNWVGKIENIVESIKKVKICVSPLITGAGIRGKVNQYTIVGRPTVSTNIGICGTPYVNQESALVADDPQEFANHVIALLTDPKRYAEITQNAELVAKTHFYWDQQIESLERFFKETAAE